MIEELNKYEKSSGMFFLWSSFASCRGVWVFSGHTYSYGRETESVSLVGNEEMNKRVLLVVFTACIACIILRLVIPRKPDVPRQPKQNDLMETAREASKTQGKLLVMRIFGTTTVYRENRATTKATAQVGYVHEGSADIVVDLTKSEFQYQVRPGSTNLLIIVPYPELDHSTVGIDPSRLWRVTSIPRTSLRSQEVFNELEDECKRVILDKQYSTFASVDVIEDAKIQAQRVLANFYRECVDGEIEVDVEFKGGVRPCLSNPDVTETVNGSTGKDR